MKAFSIALQKRSSNNLLHKPVFRDCESAPSRKAELECTVLVAVFSVAYYL